MNRKLSTEQIVDFLGSLSHESLLELQQELNLAIATKEHELRQAKNWEIYAKTGVI